MNRALIVVDVQRDFCHGGALAAADTLTLLQPLHDFIVAARQAGVHIVFTQDWHPSNHSSFRNQGGPWPVHCLANSPGAELMPPLRAEASDLLIHKGETVAGPGYSGFDGTALAETLPALAVQDLAVCGVATEYCVRATALDAAKAGLRVSVLSDLVRPVKVNDGHSALQEMSGHGVAILESQLWLPGAGTASPFQKFKTHAD
jgi:nicotinamidase/pyrazinamidase